MKTLTEFFGASIAKAHETLGQFSTQKSKELTETLSKDLEVSVKEELTNSKTEELKAAMTETLSAQGKSEEEIQKTIQALVETAVESSYKEVLQTKLKEQVAQKLNEETSAKIAEEFKLEGDKLARFMNVIEMTRGKRGRIKRVILVALEEGQKPLANAVIKDNIQYLTEFFPEPLRAEKPKKSFGRDGKGKGRFDKKGGKRGERGGRGGDRESNRGSNRNDRFPNTAPAGLTATDSTVVSANGAPPAEKKRFKPRPPRKPRDFGPPPPRPILRSQAEAAASQTSSAQAPETKAE